MSILTYILDLFITRPRPLVYTEIEPDAAPKKEPKARKPKAEKPQAAAKKPAKEKKPAAKKTESVDVTGVGAVVETSEMPAVVISQGEHSTAKKPAAKKPAAKKAPVKKPAAKSDDNKE
jgi:trigger factor